MLRSYRSYNLTARSLCSLVYLATSGLLSHSRVQLSCTTSKPKHQLDKIQSLLKMGRVQEMNRTPKVGLGIFRSGFWRCGFLCRVMGEDITTIAICGGSPVCYVMAGAPRSSPRRLAFRGIPRKNGSIGFPRRRGRPYSGCIQLGIEVWGAKQNADLTKYNWRVGSMSWS